LYEDFTKSLTADKILNLVVIFAACDLPDCAAEVVLKFRPLLAPLCDADRMLDLLAVQADGKLIGSDGSYRRQMERFARRPAEFLGTRNPFLRMARAGKKGYLKWRGRMQLLGLEREGR